MSESKAKKSKTAAPSTPVKEPAPARVQVTPDKRALRTKHAEQMKLLGKVEKVVEVINKDVPGPKTELVVVATTVDGQAKVMLLKMRNTKQLDALLKRKAIKDGLPPDEVKGIGQFGFKYCREDSTPEPYDSIEVHADEDFIFLEHYAWSVSGRVTLRFPQTLAFAK